jgi:hypothetical protein
LKLLSSFFSSSFPQASLAEVCLKLL